jgi:hypothetical protein
MEKQLRQQARVMYQMAEQMRLVRHAQEGTLANYLVTKEVRKAQNKMNRMVRKSLGLK